MIFHQSRFHAVISSTRQIGLGPGTFRLRTSFANKMVGYLIQIHY